MNFTNKSRSFVGAFLKTHITAFVLIKASRRLNEFSLIRLYKLLIIWLLCRDRACPVQ